jgi:MoaA/NifB/PqqE/SkfB family radical SAM enzyme
MLLNQEVEQITRGAKEAGIKPSLATTLTVNQNALRNLRELSYIHTSIDGPAPIHNLIRGRPDAFELLLNGVKIVRNCGIPVGASMVLSDANCNPQSAQATIEIAEEIGLAKLSIYSIARIGEATRSDPVQHSKMLRVYQWIKDNHENYSIPIELIRFPTSEYRGSCYAQNFLVITPKLKIGPCPWLVQSRPNIVEEDTSDLATTLVRQVANVKTAVGNNCEKCSSGCMANVFDGHDCACPVTIASDREHRRKSQCRVV